MLDRIRSLWDHLVWSDKKLLEALEAVEPGSTVFREYAHIIGAEEVWLSRLEGRPSRAAVWPTVHRDELEQLVAETHAAFGGYLKRLTDDDLAGGAEYTNSAGRSFSTPVADILLHVMLHGQYHRGKINLLLRQSDREPAPTDYIAFVRGAPAATSRP